MLAIFLACVWNGKCRWLSVDVLVPLTFSLCTCYLCFFSNGHTSVHPGANYYFDIFTETYSKRIRTEISTAIETVESSQKSPTLEKILMGSSSPLASPLTSPAVAHHHHHHHQQQSQPHHRHNAECLIPSPLSEPASQSADSSPTLSPTTPSASTHDNGTGESANETKPKAKDIVDMLLESATDSPLFPRTAKGKVAHLTDMPFHTAHG